jgi:hypothetical protein
MFRSEESGGRGLTPCMLPLRLVRIQQGNYLVEMLEAMIVIQEFDRRGKQLSKSNCSTPS